MAKLLQVLHAVDKRYYQWAAAGLIILAAVQWALYAPKVIVDFLNAKGPDLIVTAVGTLFAFGTAIWIYRWQVNDAENEAKQQAIDAVSAEKTRIRNDKQVELDAIQRRRLDHILWFISILKQISNYAKGQADEMETFVAEIRREPSEIHQLGRIASYATQRLTRPDNEPTFHAYNVVFANDPDKDKHYGELLGSADFVIATIAEILETFKRYLQNLYDRHLKLKAMIEQVMNDIATLNLSMSAGGAHDVRSGSAFQLRVNKSLLFNQKLIDTSSNLRAFVTFLTKPLIPIFLAERHFPGVDSILIQLKNINVAFTDLTFESEGFADTAFNPDKLRIPVQNLDAACGRLENGYNSAEAMLAL